MFSIKSNIDQFTRDLDDMAKTQIPIATAWTINILARAVVAGEVEEIQKDFPTATPFTKRAFGYLPATKYNQYATVFTREIQETYLEPYTDGGQSVPTPGGGMVVPVKVPVNQYGNIPYRKLRSLMSNKNVFYANKSNPKFHGKYSGIFERYIKGTGPRGGKITGLITLAKIRDPWNVKQHFEFEERAMATIEREIEGAWEQSLLKALGSMR